MVLIQCIKAVLFGIVEGITEWLPISSTGHMILLDEFVKLGFGDAEFDERFYSMFEVVIQLGAILAVFLLFLGRLNPFALSKSAEEKKATWILWGKVVLAILPSGILGILVDDWMEAHLYNYVVVAVALIIYGIAFIVIERWKKGEPRVTDVGQVTVRDALLVGVFQCLSLIPGTSRSGSTILGGILIGLTRTTAAEFTFFMSIPTMGGASLIRGYKFFDYLLESGVSVPWEAWLVLGVGCAVAFVVSFFAIRFLMDFVKRHSFAPFGVYRIILGILVLIYFMIAG